MSVNRNPDQEPSRRPVIERLQGGIDTFNRHLRVPATNAGLLITAIAAMGLDPRA